jgi:MFS family permease
MLFSAFKHSNYRYFFIATIISNIGTWSHRVAQDWLTLELTGSAKSLGLIVAAQFVPGIVFAIYGGVLADRYDQKRILFWCNFAGFFVATAVGTLVALGQITFPLLLIAAFFLGIISAIDGPVRQSYYVLLVGEKDLPNALSWNQVNLNAGRLIGPITAGLLIQFLGISPSFLLNGLSYIIAVLLLGFIATGSYYPAHNLAASQERVTFFESIRYLKENRTVLIPIGVVSLVAMVGQDMQMTSALMARKVFDVQPASFGLLGSVIALGAIAGSLFVARSKATIDITFLGQRTLYMGATWIFVGLAPNYLTYALTLFFAGYFAMGVNITGNMSIRTYADPRHYGRIWGIYISLWLAAIAVGGPILGWISDTFSIRSAIFFGAIFTLVISLLVQIKAKKIRLAANEASSVNNQ